MGIPACLLGSCSWLGSNPGNRVWIFPGRFLTSLFKMKCKSYARSYGTGRKPPPLLLCLTKLSLGYTRKVGWSKFLDAEEKKPCHVFEEQSSGIRLHVLNAASSIKPLYCTEKHPPSSWIPSWSHNDLTHTFLIHLSSGIKLQIRRF